MGTGCVTADRWYGRLQSPGFSRMAISKLPFPGRLFVAFLFICPGDSEDLDCYRAEQKIDDTLLGNGTWKVGRS